MLAGSAAFESTFRRMRYLERARNRAYELLRARPAEGKLLPANLPAFVLEQEKQLGTYVRSRIDAALAKRRTAPFDSHPADGGRLRLAHEALAPGLVRLPGASTDLLGDFDALATQATTLHYAEDLRLPVGPAILANP